MEGDPREILRDNIERLKARRGITSNSELATRAGVDASTVNRLMKRPLEVNPTIEKVEKIGLVFGLAPWQLYMPGLPMDDRANRTLRGGMSCAAYRLAAALTASPQETAREILAFAGYALHRSPERKAKAFADEVREEG